MGQRWGPVTLSVSVIWKSMKRAPELQKTLSREPLRCVDVRYQNNALKNDHSNLALLTQLC